MYKFGFNGQLKDNEIYGEGNAYDYGDREYDPRSIRWWKVDKMKSTQPGWAPYKAFLGNPLIYKDKQGKTEFLTIVVNNEATGMSMSITVVKSSKVLKGVYTQIDSWDGGYHHGQGWRDFETTYTYNINKDGHISSSVSTVILDNVSVITTGLIRNWEGYANFKASLGSIDFNTGPGGRQIGGIYMTSKSGGASPTRQKADFSIPMLDADDLFSALGGIKTIDYKKPESLLEKVILVLEKLSDGMNTKSSFDAAIQTPKADSTIQLRTKQEHTPAGYMIIDIYYEKVPIDTSNNDQNTENKKDK